MHSLVVLATLYTLTTGHALIYHYLMKGPCCADETDPTYAKSAFTRSFRYLLPALYFAILADFPLALYLLEVGPVPRWQLGAGFAVGMVSLALLAWSLESLGANFACCFAGRLPRKVVRRGPYRFMAHPIYLANFLLLLAFHVILFNWLLLALSLSLMAFYVRSMVEEERALARLEEG